MKRIIATDGKVGAWHRTVRLGGYYAPGHRERETTDVSITTDLTRARERLSIGNLELPAGATPTSWRVLVKAMGNRSEAELANPNAVY